MLTTLQATLRGLVLNPVLVAFVRSVVEAMVMAALLVGYEFVAGGNLDDGLQMWAPLVLLLIRNAEGLADKIDPAKQRRRDELRQAAAVAEVDDGITVINRGDVHEFPRG